MEKIESKAFIYAHGGMDIGNVAALMDTIGSNETIIIDNPVTNGKKIDLPASPIKHFAWILAAIIALIIVSPFLIVISLFILASSISSVVFKKKGTVMGDKSFIKPGQLKTWNILPDGNELNFQTKLLLRRN